MHKLKFSLILVLVAQVACVGITAPATPLPLSSEPTKDAQALIMQSTPVLPTLMPSATVTLEPTIIPPPVISPESFGQVKVLHEYWPVISKAAGLSEAALFGNSITAWAYSPDGRYLAVGGCDAEAGSGFVYAHAETSCEMTISDTVSHAYLLILDVKSEGIIATLPETGEVITVTQLSFTPDGNKLVYGLDSGKVAVWDIPSAQIQSVLSEEGTDSLKFNTSPNNKWIALANNEHLTRIWDIAQEKFIAELPNGGGLFLRAPQFSADGQMLLIADFPYLVIYDTSTWQELTRQNRMPDGLDNTYNFSPDLSLMAMCDIRRTDDPGPMKILNVATGELLQTLQGEWNKNRCARLLFSPDSHSLLRFDNHANGPLIWEAEGWKFFKESFNQTSFASAGDRYVDDLQFSQDGQTVMVDTLQRLTLYALPQSGSASAFVVPVASPIAHPTSAPMQAVKAQSCDIKVSGSLKLDLHPCTPPSRAVGGMIDDGIQEIWFVDSSFLGVSIQIPPFLLKKLSPGSYILGAADDGAYAARMIAFFHYTDPLDPLHESSGVYDSYDGGTFIFTQAGLDQDYISGSFSFGAHELSTGRQINVEGTFENIPFSHINGP